MEDTTRQLNRQLWWVLIVMALLLAAATGDMNGFASSSPFGD